MERLRTPSVAQIARAWTTIAAGTLIAFVAAYIAFDGLRPWLREKGGVTETMTAGALAGAVVIGIWVIRRTPHHEPAMWLVPAAALIAFADEIRWGVELAGFTPPTLAGEPIAGIADLVDLAAGRLTSNGVNPAVMAVGLATFGGIVCLRWLGGVRGRALRHAVTDRPWATRLVAAGAATAAASILDLATGGHIRFAEEAMELASAFLLTLAALEIPATPGLRSWHSRLEPWRPDDRQRTAA